MAAIVATLKHQKSDKIRMPYHMENLQRSRTRLKHVQAGYVGLSASTQNIPKLEGRRNWRMKQDKQVLDY